MFITVPQYTEHEFMIHVLYTVSDRTVLRTQAFVTHDDGRVMLLIYYILFVRCKYKQICFRF